MRYLENTVIALPRVVKREDTGEDATFPYILKRLMENYTPTDQLRLNIRDLRVLNRAIDALEREPEGGFYALETDEFDMVRRVLEHLGPALIGGMARNAPALLDALDATASERPAPAPVSPVPSVDGVKEAPMEVKR